MGRDPTLEDDYGDAWAQWSADGEDQVWDRATDDGAVDSKAQAERIRSVAVERLRRRIGHVPAVELTQLDEALRLHLEL